MSISSTLSQNPWNHLSLLHDGGRSCCIAEVQQRLSFLEKLEAVARASARIYRRNDGSNFLKGWTVFDLPSMLKWIKNL